MNQAISSETGSQPGIAKLGWGILLLMSALLILHGASWFFIGPEISLANLAERASLDEEGFRQGSPSSFDVITLITRNYSAFEVAFGVFALVVVWKGFRTGSRWAWMASWVLVFGFAVLAANFVLAGGLGGGSPAYLAAAVLALAGQLLAGRGLSSRGGGAGS